ncbi:hypothetical protein D3C80_1495600 [compost metagenome]
MQSSQVVIGDLGILPNREDCLTLGLGRLARLDVGAAALDDEILHQGVGSESFAGRTDFDGLVHIVLGGGGRVSMVRRADGFLEASKMALERMNAQASEGITAPGEEFDQMHQVEDAVVHGRRRQQEDLLAGRHPLKDAIPGLSLAPGAGEAGIPKIVRLVDDDGVALGGDGLHGAFHRVPV